MTRAWAAVTTVAVACSFLLLVPAPALAAGTHKIEGTFALKIGTNPLGVCTGSGGYNDIQQGAQVLVRNGNSKILAKSQLKIGIGSPTGTTCIFEFSVKVPDSKFYSFEISHRGEIAYAFKDMQRMKWAVALSLG